MASSTSALQLSAGPFSARQPPRMDVEDRHANRVYTAGAAAALLFLGATLGTIAGWFSAVAYLLSATASSGLLCVVIKLGHTRSPLERARRGRACRRKTEPEPR